MAENYFGNTDTGKLRDNNEDAFIAEKVWNGQMIAACVIDGVGGYEGGEVAASIARETILNHLQKRDGEIFDAMKHALTDANEKIYHEKTQNKERQSMACVLTLALADIENNQFYYIHIGDTRLYLLRDRSLVKVTKDHSFVGYLEDSKRLTEDEAMRHPKRNEINKALGFDPNMAKQADYMELGQSPFLPGDTLLLCSDGLTDLVNSNDITNILISDASLEQKTKTLIDEANKAGGKDNITVVLVQNDKKPLKHRATKPVLLKKKSEEKNPEPLVQSTEPPLIIESPNKGSKGVTVILALLCVALMALAFWLWKKQPATAGPTPAVQAQAHNAAEQRVNDLIEKSNQSEVILADSAQPGSVTITDTLFIQRDSMHIVGNGLMLRSDSSYRGAAIVVAPHVKFVVIENISFQDFETGIIAPSRSLYLINVKFNNCNTPLLSRHQLPAGVLINAQLLDSVNYNYDTLQKPTK